MIKDLGSVLLLLVIMACILLIVCAMAMIAVDGATIIYEEIQKLKDKMKK